MNNIKKTEKYKEMLNKRGIIPVEIRQDRYELEISFAYEIHVDNLVESMSKKEIDTEVWERVKKIGLKNEVSDGRGGWYYRPYLKKEVLLWDFEEKKQFVFDSYLEDRDSNIEFIVNLYLND